MQEGETEEEGQGLASLERRSLWRELRIAKALIILLLLESLLSTDLDKHLAQLSDLCKDSKRKRLPQMCTLDSS